MNILPISTAEQTTANQTPIVTTGPKTLGQEDFLKLIAVQMKSQDPMNPMKDTEFISQMANFTSLEQMKNLTSSFEAFVSQQRSIDAQSYLGKTVTLLAGETGVVSGQVSGINFEEGTPRLVVNGTAYDPALVTSIQISAN
jgi:flagellar basal-body rod modification protein FlgD